MQIRVVAGLAAITLAGCDQGDVLPNRGASPTGEATPEIVHLTANNDPALFEMVPLTLADPNRAQECTVMGSGRIAVRVWSTRSRDSGRVNVFSQSSRGFVRVVYSTPNRSVRYQLVRDQSLKRTDYEKGVILRTQLPAQGREAEHLQKLGQFVESLPCTSTRKNEGV